MNYLLDKIIILKKERLIPFYDVELKGRMSCIYDISSPCNRSRSTEISLMFVASKTDATSRYMLMCLETWSIAL